MICDECETVAHCSKHGCIPKHQALDKMAENARELGLDYEQYKDSIEVSVIFHEGQKMFAVPKQPAQQEPAGSVYRYGKDSSGTPWHGIRWTASGLDLPDGTLIYTSPPAQRTWQGLTFAEICECENDYLHIFARAIEAKLKEKNT
jgi:hypothetical protein